MHKSEENMQTIKLFFFKRTILAVLLLLGSFQVQAFTIDFNITHGVVCPLNQSCSFGYYDPAGSFQGDIQADGTMLFADPIEFVFNGGTQGFSMLADGGSLTANPSNGAVVDGVIPHGNWDGLLHYTTSLGGTGDFILDSNISFNTLFIDNVDDSFTLSVMDPFGLSIPGNNTIGASFIISGTTSLSNQSGTSGTVPTPASIFLIMIGLVGMWLSKHRFV